MPRLSAARVDFATLYDDTVDVAWRVLARLGVRAADLEDAVQDVFVIAHRQLPTFRGEAQLSTWVTGISIRVAHDHRRRSARKPSESLEPHATSLVDGSRGPDEQVARSEAEDTLAHLLSALEARQREVFVLAELEQLTAPEIADLTQVPVNTVYSRLRLARAHFNQQVEELNRGRP
jgi:RNA polymerase sigma-70 factor (ECF subfamily)